MAYISGRIFKDPALPGINALQRRHIYTQVNETLARIHKVDIDKAGLGEYGKRGM
jgi:aminoglycoside phosphotransferase (APT) family kinase protein